MKPRTYLGTLCLLAAATALAQQPGRTVDPYPRDSRSQEQKQQDRTMGDVRQAYDRQQSEQQREANRDKSHDGRWPVRPNTSVGGNQLTTHPDSPPQRGAVIDIKRTY